MSTPEELFDDQDPDYISGTSDDQVQQKIYQENARNTTARKITAIVEKEFSQEIDSKEKEILQIQERLHKILKTLHFLRYVIITDFYNRKQCQIPQSVETTKQTRIHPAIKSMIGKSPKLAHYIEPTVPSTSTDPRFLFTDESLTSDASTLIASVHEDDIDEYNAKKRKFVGKESESRPRKVPRYVPPKSSMPENACPSRGERHKVCKRIIVGNISKWILPDWREDAASHKWTMYVRGDKDNADISAFVSKVRFFLHPSYRPNDVVEVTSYPFHLSRRGWGEFPLRVQLHFKNPLNKPMDIIHHLKLDRTYTGLQTLGSETVVDLWIHVADSRNCDRNTRDESVNSFENDTQIKIELDGYNVERPIVFEEARVKEEVVRDSETHKSLEQPSDIALIEVSRNVEIKAEPDNTTYASATNIHLFTDLDTSRLEKTRLHINREHDYTSKTQYCSFDRRTEREGNVTIEHFSENKFSSESSRSNLLAVNEKKSTIVSQRFNGDIQPASVDCQPSAFSNARDKEEDNSQVLRKLEHMAFQFEAKSSQASESSASSDVSENTKVALIAINGFCKPSDVSLNQPKNLQRTVDSRPDIYDKRLKPLEVHIPPLFLTPKKHVLLVKNNGQASMMMKKFLNDDAKVPIASDAAKLNIPHGTSILKKPLINNIKANVNNAIDKKTTAIKLKNANGFLLNVNCNVPALKVVDARDSQYNYNLSDANKRNNIPMLIDVNATDKRESVCTKSESRRDEKAVQRTKIALCKDKYKIQSKQDQYEMVLQSIESARITDTEAFVRFAIRRLPMITRDARDPEYKRLHPYACCSEEEFFAQNVGKQRALEWHRARMIRCYLRKKSISDDQLWNVKEIMMWARLHGYTSIQRDTFKVPKAVSAANDTKRLLDSSTSTTVLLSTCTEPIAFQKWLQTCQQESSHRSTGDRVEDIDIDIESIDEKPRGTTIDRQKNNENSESSALVPLELDKSLMPLHSFVCDTARDIGIKIGPEEIVSGVMFCAAGRVMMRVVECFVEDLTRSSLASAWKRNSDNGCPTITPEDVRNALVSREEFDIFTNDGLGSRQQQFSTMN